MTTYELKEVTDKKTIRVFLNMSENIYKGDDNWVRPLDNDIEKIFSPEKNHLFDGGEAIRWVLYNGNEPVGRIAAFYNHHKANASEQLTGGCGFFECIDSQEAANTLFDAACEWLKEKGMLAMDGPINFGSREMFWGCLVEGFEHPMYGMNYNKPYYAALFESYGFQNYFNQHSHRRFLTSNEMNEAVYAKAQRLAENPDYSFSHITKGEIKGLGRKVQSIYNKAWANFTGVEAMTDEEADNLEKSMSPIIDPDIIYLAYYKGEAIGFFVMLPDLNTVIKSFKGKLGLLQKIQLMYRLKVKKSSDVMNAILFGVIPEFQGKGIESGMMKCCEDTMAGRTNYKYIELVWIGDFNPLMLRMVETYVCAKRFKRHITYRYMIDKSLEFKRAPRVYISRKQAE